jgi:hypothetical protein
VARLMAATLLAWTAGLAAAEKPPANLFTNPSFEQGRDGWRMDKAGKTDARFTVDTADARDGQSSALVTIGAVDDWGTQFGQSFDAGAKGKTYTFAALAKATKGPVKVNLQIERAGEPYDRAARSEEVMLKPGEWTELHVTFKVEKDFKQGWFAYASCAQPNCEYRLDMVRLYEGEYVPYAKAAAEQAIATGVSLFDTGAASSAALAADAVAKAAGWVQVPAGKAAHAFKGDAVLRNDWLAVVLRRGASGAEVYSVSAQPAAMRAVLAPAADPRLSDTGGMPTPPLRGHVSGEGQNMPSEKRAGHATPDNSASPESPGASAVGGKMESVAIAKNSPDAVAVDAVFAVAGGRKLALRYELAMGQVFVRTEPRDGAKALCVAAPCRFIVLPDFFADDIVADAADIPVPAADLPSENFLLHMLGAGEAVLMTVSSSRDEDVRVTLAGQGPQRTFAASRIAYGKDGKVWVAVLEAPGVWHRRDVAREETGKTVGLDWKMPYPAQWRLDWRQADRLTGSWEMLLARPGGDFLKPAVFGDEGTIPADRKRWTTVLGQFKYPCWIDQNGQGWMQPLKSDIVRFVGPAILYPINRVKKTPLEAFTVADIARATLGVGPCEYVLDVEGQGSHYEGRATCATRDALRPIYQARQQKAKRAEIEKVLDEVMVFVRHIRGRIDAYVDFGHKTLAYLEEQKKVRPELAPFVAEMAPLCKAIDGYVEKRKNEIKTVEYTQGMVDEFRRTMLDYEGPDALEKCKKFTADLVDIGGNQDELAGECRMAVKVVRQRAALAAATDPRAADVAREIRSRTQVVLRNPAGHEGARH